MRLFLAALSLTTALAAPALAADRLVPANATGALAEHKGKPWREPLTNCAGFHTWNMRNLKQAGNTAAAWDEAGKAADFTLAAASRISADNGMTLDQAKADNQPDIQNIVTYLDFEAVPPDAAGWSKVCAEYLSAYRKAFP